MAVSRSTAVLLIAAIAGFAAAEEPRPNMTEYEAQQAEEAAAASAAAAKKSKMVAVQKVISMLETLDAKVYQEGEEEAKTYNKFACFCKDTTTDKLDAITKGEDAKNSISADIGALTQERNQLDTTIQGLLQDIADLEEEIKIATETRTKEKEDYAKNEADLSGALVALKGAIEQLKTAKSSLSLAQLQAVAKTVSTAAVMADALGLGGESVRKTTAFFLQEAPTVPTEDYAFKSDSIISTLEQLQTDFRAKKEEIDQAEVSAAALHDQFMQTKTDAIKGKNTELETAKKEKAQKQELIATNSADLSTVAAELLDDKEYVKELSKMCGDKARAWDQRVQVRTDEISAIHAAIDILKGAVSNSTSGKTIRFAQQAVQVRVAEALAKNEAAMEAVEAATEEAEASGSASVPSFLQRQLGSPGTDGRQEVITLLKNKGALLRSTALTALASELAADPFAKVKVLIQELIERLQQQAVNEANQKGWCDKSRSAAKQKRDYAAQEIEELNGNMARMEATRDTLAEELDVLAKEIKELTDKQTEAVAMRAKEKAENEETITEADAGLTAVQEAITILDRFYKTSAKATVEFLHRGPAEDAPDAGFGDSEAYKGSQSDAAGVIGMLEVIESDFRRTISETTSAEAQAEEDHIAFMTETGASLAQKKVAQTEKTTQKDDVEDKLSGASDNLKSQVSIVKTAIQELLQLKDACETGMSYSERVARREDEIAALRKALCILHNYAQFGPDAAGDQC